MRTFLLILVLCVSGMAQEFVGTANGKAYYIMDAVRQDRAVKFVGVISPYNGEDLAIDKQNHLLTSFIADCINYRYVSKAYLYVIKGKTSQGLSKGEIMQAVKPQLIYKAITMACEETQSGVNL